MPHKLRKDTGAALDSQSRDNGYMVEMSAEAFEHATEEALAGIPDDLVAQMDNVVIVVEDEPPAGEPDLLGLYEGVALTDRGDMGGIGELPDRISIFRGPLLRMCEDEEEVRHEIAVTVVHEIAHHFGIEEERLHQLGWG